MENQKDVLAALANVQQKTGAKFIWLDSLICHEEICRAKIEDTYIYRDAGHLSHSGSELLLSELNFLK